MNELLISCVSTITILRRCACLRSQDQRVLSMLTLDKVLLIDSQYFPRVTVASFTRCQYLFDYCTEYTCTTPCLLVFHASLGDHHSIAVTISRRLLDQFHLCCARTSTSTRVMSLFTLEGKANQNRIFPGNQHPSQESRRKSPKFHIWLKRSHGPMPGDNLTYIHQGM
jgi:hypothetical protein